MDGVEGVLSGIDSDVVDNVVKVADFLVDGVDLGAAAVGTALSLLGEFLILSNEHINIVLLVSNYLGKVLNNDMKVSNIFAGVVAAGAAGRDGRNGRNRD